MRIIAFLAILAAAGFAACGGDSMTSPSGSGRLSLMIKDSPYSDAKALLVTFSRIEMGKAGLRSCPSAIPPRRRAHAI